MARFTSLEFMEALGLGYFDYNGAKILLRCLASKGIAKPVGKVRPTGKGRPMVVYEIPDEITLKVTPPSTMPCHPTKKNRKKEEDPSTQEPEKITVAQIVEQAAEREEFEWDDGWDDE